MLSANPPASGMMTLMPINAELTKNVAILSSQSPYVIFLLGDNKVESEVCKHGGKTPVWNAVLNISKSASDDVLKVDLYHDRSIGKDKHIGGTQIILSEFFDKGEPNGWFNLYHDGEYRGRINLGITIELEGVTTQGSNLVAETMSQNTTGLATTKPSTGIIENMPIPALISTNTIPFRNLETPVTDRNEDKRVTFSEVVTQKEYEKDQPWNQTVQQGFLQQGQMPIQQDISSQVITPNTPEARLQQQRVAESLLEGVPDENKESIENRTGVTFKRMPMEAGMADLNSDMRNQTEKMTQENLVNQQNRLNQENWLNQQQQQQQQQNMMTEQKSPVMMGQKSPILNQVPLQVVTETTNITQTSRQPQMMTQDQGKAVGMQFMQGLEGGQQAKEISRQNMTNVPNAQGSTMIQGVTVIPLQDAIQMALRQTSGQGQPSSSSS